MSRFIAILTGLLGGGGILKFNLQYVRWCLTAGSWDRRISLSRTKFGWSRMMSIHKGSVRREKMRRFINNLCEVKI